MFWISTGHKETRSAFKFRRRALIFYSALGTGHLRKCPPRAHARGGVCWQSNKFHNMRPLCRIEAILGVLDIYRSQRNSIRSHFADRAMEKRFGGRNRTPRKSPPAPPTQGGCYTRGGRQWLWITRWGILECYACLLDVTHTSTAK